ncbi:MAG: helix-turn-helix transcriptional regulator, partial [Bdellovibrionales bacterium]|nr:helix-turn-helix transcriptional regulator [Bdellovibrionales bacterium]
MQSFSEDSKKFLRKDLLKKNLSKREIEVVMLVLEGSTNREVAHDLCVAEKTVKFHLTNVYKKLNISRRSQIFWKLPLADFISINE